MAEKNQKNLSKRTKKSRRKKVGLAPGTPVYIGSKPEGSIKLSAFIFNGQEFNEKNNISLEDCIKLLTESSQSSSVLWINIDGLHDVPLIQTIANTISLHPLVIEDIVNTAQRPKNVPYDSYLHTTLRMLELNPTTKRVESEQLSLILGKNFIITFQEQTGDCFDPLRERLRLGRGRARASGADYLFYAIIDCVVDHYFVVVEDIDDRIESLEETLLLDPDRSNLATIHRARRELLHARRALWPLREVLQTLIRDENPLISQSTHVFLRDIYDHVIEALEVVDLLRETSSGLVELFVSHGTAKANEVMKTLTVIATIFMPLTFIVGVYGMNFQIMPELSWRYGYLGVWVIMIAIALGMVLQFRRRGWL